MQRNERVKASTFLILGQLMVAINVVGSKYLTVHMSVLAVLFYRFFTATALLSFFCWLKPAKSYHARYTELSRREWGLITAQALCAGVLFNLLMLVGLNYTQASVAGMIISVLPALIAVLAVIFLKERMSPLTSLATLTAVLGLMIINGQHVTMGAHHQLLGDAIILVALIPEALYFLLSRYYQNRLPLFHLSLLMNGINCLALLPFLLVSGVSALTNIDHNGLQVVLITGSASAFFYVFWSMGAAYLPASKSSLFTAMSPLLIMLIAFLFLGESLTLSQGIGMALIIASVFSASFARTNA